MVVPEGGCPAAHVALLARGVLDVGLRHARQIHEVFPRPAGHHLLVEVRAEGLLVVQLLHNVRSFRFVVVPPCTVEPHVIAPLGNSCRALEVRCWVPRYRYKICVLQ